MNAMAESTASVTGTETSAHKAAVNRSKTATHETLTGVKTKPVQPKDYASKQRDKWLNKLTNELRTVFCQFPLPTALPTEICPKWVWWIQQEFFHATYPQLDLKDTKEHTVLEFAGFWIPMRIRSLDEGMFGSTD
jgi:hypothetical protein